MVLQHYLSRTVTLACAGTILSARLWQSFSLITLLNTFLGLLFVQSIAIVLLLVLVNPYFSPLKHVPRPPQAPLRQRLFKEPNAFHLEQWIDTVPNQGLIRYFGFLNMERVLLTSPELVREVLQARPYDFEKQYAQKTHLQRVAGQGLVVVEGDIHKRHRRVTVPAFKHQRIREFHNLFWSKTVELVNSISKHINASSSYVSYIENPTESQTDSISKQIHVSYVEKTVDGKLDSVSEEVNISYEEDIDNRETCGSPISCNMDIDDFINRAVFDIIGLASFGFDFKSISQPQELYEKLHDYRMAFEPSPSNKLRMLSAFALPTWAVDALPIHFNRVTAKSIDEIRALGSRIIAEKKARMQNEPPFRDELPADIMDTLVASEQLSDPELLSNFMMMQAGGVHTTAATVCSTIWWLAQPKNLHIQRKLRQEIRSKVSSPSLQQATTLEEFDSMPYLRAVRNEVLRLHSAFSWYGRKPIKKTELCGYSLPAGLSISFSPWAMQRSIPLWGPDARDFNPERWLDDLSGRGGAESTYSWLTFGAGPRTCVGEKFAKAELNCLLSGIFGRFEIEFLDDQPLPRVTQQVTVAFKDKLRAKVTVIEGW